MTDLRLEEASSALAGQRVLLLASFDSFVKAAATVGDFFKAEGAETSLALVRSRRHQVSPAQKQTLGLADELEPLPMRDLVTGEAFRRADIVVSALDGRRSRALFADMHAVGLGATQRPLIVSIYPGIVFRDHIDGFMDRAPADVICFNSRRDQDLYREACGALGMDASNGLVTGLLMLNRIASAPAPRQSRTIVYFDQPTVPRHRLQREFLLESLLDMAERLPGHSVVVKPRTQRGEETLHRTRFHLEDLARAAFKRRTKPENFRFSHEPVDRLLQDARLALTVSSTVALEACLAGVPFGIVADFGVAEHLGNHFFARSGCFLQLADIDHQTTTAPDPEWLAASGAVLSPNLLIARVRDLLNTRGENAGRLPLRTQFPANGSASYFRFAEKASGIRAIVNPEHRDFDIGSLIQSGYEALLNRLVR